jgi:hypothetical protein
VKTSTQRIAIIGNAGGGKSVLALKLGEALDIPVFQFDDLQWRPGWTRTSEDEIQITHSSWLVEPKWIIDGWGSWDILEQRFSLSDAIIFIDFDILVHYWWAAKRQLKAALNLNLGWPPEGCPALPVTMRLFKLIWKIHKEIRPQLIELINQYAEDREIVRLESPQAMKRFLDGL